VSHWTTIVLLKPGTAPEDVEDATRAVMAPFRELDGHDPDDAEDLMPRDVHFAVGWDWYAMGRSCCMVTIGHKDPPFALVSETVKGVCPYAVLVEGETVTDARWNGRGESGYDDALWGIACERLFAEHRDWIAVPVDCHS
jgi:hypothetical protein